MRVAGLHGEGHGRVGLDRADAVDAGHGGDDDDVVALEQRARGGVAHAVDLLVDRGFFLDVGVGARHVGFGLVVVVVGDEVLDRVVGEEALELAVELRRQRLVGRQDQRRALRRGDDVRHGEGLARAGDAEQHLVALLPARRRPPARRWPWAGRRAACSRTDQLERRAALGLLRPLGPVRHEHRHAAGHQRMAGDHRLPREQLAGALGALVRAWRAARSAPRWARSPRAARGRSGARGAWGVRPLPVGGTLPSPSWGEG